MTKRSDIATHMLARAAKQRHLSMVPQYVRALGRSSQARAHVEVPPFPTGSTTPPPSPGPPRAYPLALLAGAPIRPATGSPPRTGYYAPTMALQKFERRLERFVEGAFALVFRSGLQPVEIGRRLTREIDLRRTVAPRGVLAPNSFRVVLSETDRAKFRPIEEELARELVEVAREHAKVEGYVFLGPVGLSIENDSALRPGTMRVAGDMVPDQGTATLTLPDGRRVVLEHDKVTLGRLPECEVALADAGISRRHAAVNRGPDNTWLVSDLGSTNGTKVNGLRIQGPRELADGDEITVGSTTVRFTVTGNAATGAAGPGPASPEPASVQAERAERRAGPAPDVERRGET